MKNNIKPLWWFAFLIIYLELLYKSFALKTIFSFNTIYMLPFSLIYISILTIISGLSKNKTVNKSITFILTITITIYNLSQFVYYNFYNSFISLYSIGMGTVQVFGFFDQILEVMFNNFFIVILYITPIIILSIFNKYFDFSKNTKNRYILNSIVLFSGIVLSILTLQVNKKDLYSNYNLFYNVNYPTLTINRFGITTTSLLDASRYLTNFKEKYLIKNDKTNYKYDKEIYNVIDINFDDLLKNETSDEIKSMHKYFMNEIPTLKNKYTGIFKGKNLIFINAESLDDFAISETLTPTLYKLTHEGFIFDNYYVPIFPISTSDGEYMNSTGLLPKEGVWSLFESSKISTPYSLAHTFGKLGYSTYAYHNHSYDYYSRQLTYPKLGFKSYKACGNGLEELINCKLFPESDMEMFAKTKNEYIKNTPFLAYYVTMSGHLRYHKNNDMAKKHWKDVKEIKGSNKYKSYLSQNIDLDKALNNLINYLKKNELLNDTVIVIAPDHFPYGFNDNDMKKIDREKVGLFNKYKNTLVIWNPEIDNIHITKTTASIDIIPTLYNLFGIEYDSRLFIGRDALSNNENIAMLANRSFKTDKVEYNALTNKYVFYNEDDEDISYLNDIKKQVYSKFTISSKIIENDYYSKLAKYID